MPHYALPETSLMHIQSITETDREGRFTIEPLSPGYGVTLGNALRRVLLSSLEGSAVSAVRIDGVTHEFTTVSGMKEDVVELLLNLKTLRVKLLSDEPTTLRLDAKGSGEVRAKAFEKNPNVHITEPDHYLATLDKQGKLVMEVLIEHGRGYVPTEQKRTDQLPLGTISLDSIFTPVKKVHYEVENTRVGKMTNFDKLTLDITTDGTVEPRAALAHAAQILLEHFQLVSQVSTGDVTAKLPEIDESIGEVSAEQASEDREEVAPAVPKKATKKVAKKDTVEKVSKKSKK